MTNQEALEFIRREIALEFSLLDGRVTWFASCQAFLITAFTLSLSNPAVYQAGWLAHFALPILGLSLCIIVLPGILGAHSTIQAWLTRQHGLLNTESAKVELSSIIVSRFLKCPKTDRLHNRSLWFSILLPGLIGLFWIASISLIRLIPIKHAL